MLGVTLGAGVQVWVGRGPVGSSWVALRLHYPGCIKAQGQKRPSHGK